MKRTILANGWTEGNIPSIYLTMQSSQALVIGLFFKYAKRDLCFHTIIKIKMKIRIE